MWDTLILPARGNFSLRKIARSFLAVIVSALLLTIINSAVTHAADATWQDDGSIKYNDKVYRQETPVPDGVQAAEGSIVYIAKDDTQKTASVMTIPPNTDQTKEIKNVTVTEYTLTQDGGYTLQPNQRPPTLTLAAKPAAKNKTQCDVAGIGWIVCVTSRFIAGGMDNIFTIIAKYLEVKPVSTDTGSGLFKAWSVALGIANLMFILAFLVIIYSQITSVGLNNYNIKKMIPKLIVAAVLVNVSYYICSIAVDVSNVLGYSVQQALIDVRKSLPDPVPGSLDSFTWKNITEYILSGGTIVAGAFAAKAAFLGGAAGGSISGLTFLLFPILVSGALAVLVALLILAARQAIITVLIVVAPLAFVAYLLPNTEKWFEKWRELFTTMLLVFPLFSLLFGGSQLASYIIIQNADQISIILFAMFVQVAPLVMTPFLVKFSGSLLGRIAGMVNDPKRGLVDRASNWAKDKAEVQRAKGFEAAAAPGGRGGTRYQRQAFRREKDRMNREAWKKRGESHVDAAWHNDERYGMHHTSIATAELRKKAGESKSNRHFENEIMTGDNKRMLQRYIGREMVDNEAIKVMQDARKASYEESKSDKMEPTNMFASTSNEAKAILRQQKVVDGKLDAASTMQTVEFVKALSDKSNPAASAALRQRVGGIDPNGANKALAKAKAAAVAAKAEVVKQIEDASDIMPGDTDAMVDGFNNAVTNGNIEEVRAYTNMLAKSADKGIRTLRAAMMAREADMENNGIIEEFKFHVDSHQGLNNDAEDMVTWSRGDRTLGAVNADAGVWGNLSATKFMAQKRSSQEAAIDSGGVSFDTAKRIMLSPNLSNVKEPVIERLRVVLGINPDGSQDKDIEDLVP